ncbi:hypothetical protein A1D23_10290 [Chelonobacter oris]|uniref:hypothetical protein n=1 Tax=Chelonobacter oris TaxID=505317 RepID=UPI002447D05F|nr:hypothetical protein [Chelonobacter oris]MDH3000845.1 hypothetical protein [Chelonobacter oris]
MGINDDGLISNQPPADSLRARSHFPQKYDLIPRSLPKQRQDTALTAEEFATLPMVIAEPSVVVRDKKHQNLIYVNQKRSIKVVVELTPKKAKFQPFEKLDTVINTYRLDFNDFLGKIKLGDYVIMKGKI